MNTVYALTNEHEIYIGKSGSCQANVNISNHMHDKCKCTQGHFALHGEDPTTIHLLVEVDSPETAKRYIAVFTEFFKSQGYTVLNPVRKHNSPADIASVLPELKNISAKALLEETKVKNASALKRSPLPKEANPANQKEKVVSLSIHLSEEERKHFADYAKN